MISKKDYIRMSTYTMSPMDANVRKWYMSEYPDDTLAAERINWGLSFNELYILFGKYGVPFDVLIGVSDTFIRDNIISELAKRSGIKVSFFYDNCVF